MSVLSIAQARSILESHGFQLYGWGGTYRVTRDIPPYGQACPLEKGFHRDWRGFGASNVSLTWVRKLAKALQDSDLGLVCAWDCSNAWAEDRKAEETWESAHWLHQYSKKPDTSYDLQAQLDKGVAAIKAEGAFKMAQLTRQVLVESWAALHPWPAQKVAA